MNAQITKVINDIEKTKAKIAELQILLPELERKKIDLENAQIVRLVRKASVEPGELAGFLNSIKSAPSTSESTAQRFANPSKSAGSLSSVETATSADVAGSNPEQNTTHESLESTAKD